MSDSILTNILLLKIKENNYRWLLIYLRTSIRQRNVTYTDQHLVVQQAFHERTFTFTTQFTRNACNRPLRLYYSRCQRKINIWG